MTMLNFVKGENYYSPSSSSKVESDTVLHTSNASLATDIVYYYSFGWLEALIDSIKFVTI